MGTPLYMATGLLDSGKTSFIKETLLDPNFNEGEKTLIISFEDGDEEFDAAFLKKTNSELIMLDSLNDFTHEFQENLFEEYDFDRVFVEANGMQDEFTFLVHRGLIRKFEIAQILCIVDASMFRLQLNNLKNLFFNHVRLASVCIFNRFDDEDEYLYIRNNLKAVNPRIELVFENSDHEIVECNEADIFDLSQGHIEVSDNDFGVWYMDCANNPDKYEGIEIEVNMRFQEDLPEYENAVIMGRSAMVCCADDIAQIGVTCVGVDKKYLRLNNYYLLKGVLRTIDDTNGDTTCILHVKSCTPGRVLVDDLVYFN